MSDDPAAHDHTLDAQACVAEFFSPGESLGTGGMSEVRLARQETLARWVAIKSATGDIGAAALVNEARVTARLNHPGIVPVIGLGHDERGRTAMFMQRVEGCTWRAFIGEGGTLSAPESWSGEPLAWHLDVLCRVARVLEYAHARGVVHRDVKPANVMIGADDGQVYLMDWGLAVALDDRHGDLPLARDVDRFAGTTGHAAPEMLDTRHRLIGVCTDVYQLGSCLHMVLTGRPPHTERDMPHRLRSILRSEPPDYGSDVAPGLADICHRAMARRPRDRFPTVAMLRRAVESVGVQLRSERRAQNGLRGLVMLRRAIAERATRDEITERFAETRFIFREALLDWPENPLALDGLQTLLETVVHYDLLAGRSERPRRLIAELPRPRPDLEARLREPQARVELLRPSTWSEADDADDEEAG